MTITYIKEHPSIKNCLKQGLINYSSLARLIAKELDIEKKMSKEAILIAARRFKESLRKELSREEDVRKLMGSSEIEVRNKISVLILKKTALDYIDEFTQKIRANGGLVYVLEGSDNYTIITQDKYVNGLDRFIIKKSDGLALIILKSPKDIEWQVGVIAYLTSLFAEHGVNILEMLSAWTDTLFVIEAKDVNLALGFLTL